MRHKNEPFRAYLPNPYGFFDGGRKILDGDIKPLVERAGFSPVEPFEEAGRAFAFLDGEIGEEARKSREEDKAWLRTFVGNLNERLISRCCAALAILEAGPCRALDDDLSQYEFGKIPFRKNERAGYEVDLGTGAEVGICGEVSKYRPFRTIGLRLSPMDAGEAGQIINLQCANSIRITGGKIVRTTEEAEALMGDYRKEVEKLLQRGETVVENRKPRRETAWDETEYDALRALDLYWDQSKFAGPKGQTTRRYKRKN